MIKTREDIINDLISSTVAQTDKITYYGRDSVIRALYSAIANTMYEIWADLYQVRRQLHLQTAEGEDLDEIARRHGITRRGAAKGSVILLFNGIAGTLIPAGTEVKTVSGVTYLTTQDIVLGSRNPMLNRPLPSNILGDVVMAESLGEGSAYKVGINELIIANIPNVSVTNFLPSVGAQDEETDAELRERIYRANDILAQGTIAFYEALAVASNNTVLRSKAKYNVLTHGVDLYVLKNSLSAYTQQELDDIANYCYANQRALTPVKCYNADIVGVDVEIDVTVQRNYSFDDVYRNVAIQLANYLDIAQKEFGTTISYYDLVSVIAKVEGVQNVKKVFLNNKQEDLKLGETQLPRFRTLIMSDYNNTQSLTLDLTYLIYYGNITNIYL